jgi:hypothetical protein
VGKAVPTGSFNFTPPDVHGVVQTYTLPEVVDLINQELQREKWVLIRYKDHFTVVPSDAELPSFPRIDLDELPQRGNSEVVSLVYPLKKLGASEVAPEVQKMLMQPFGKVVPLESSNRLILQDNVQSLKHIVETIRTIESGVDTTGRSTVVLQHVCQYQLASEAAEQLKRLLGDEKEEVPATHPKGEKGEKKVEYRYHKVAVDEATNTVLVTGTTDKIAKARAILQTFDRGREKVAIGPPFLKMYPVAGGNADSLGKILQEAYKASGSLKVAAVNSTTIAVWAGPEMQIRIAKEIMPAKEDNVLTIKAEFIPVNVSDPDRLAYFLQYAFPSEKGKSDAPVIDADARRGGILVRGTEQQVEEVRRAIASIEGEDASGSGRAGRLVINLGRGESAAPLAEALKEMLERLRPDVNIKVLSPGSESIKPEPEKKPEPPKQSPKTKRVSYRSTHEEPRQVAVGAGQRRADRSRGLADASMNAPPVHPPSAEEVALQRTQASPRFPAADRFPARPGAARSG